MSQVVKDRFNRMLDSAIVVVGTKKIVPAVVFAKIGRYSAYIEHYYMQTPRTMILIVEPISKPWHRGYVPAWREELLEVILLKLASTALVAGSYYTYVHLFYGQVFCLNRSSKEIGLCFGGRIHYWWRGPRFECWYALSLQKLCLWTEDGNFILCSTSEGFFLLKPGKQFILFLFQIQNCYCIFARFWFG